MKLESRLKLYPYQNEGSLFLMQKKYALIADPMGMGKTPQAIIAVHNLNFKRVLVVCPSTLKSNWKREFNKFAGITAKIFDAHNQPKNTQIVIANYEKVVKHHDYFFRCNYDAIILDEVHYLKEPTSARTQSIFGPKGIARKAGRVWCLSGTPAPNHAGEIWVMCNAFGKTGLSYQEFISRYCRTMQVKYSRTPKIMGTKTATSHELKSILNTFCLRRRKEDHLTELPPIRFSTVLLDAVNDPLVLFPEMKEKVRLELREINTVFKDIPDDKLLETVQLLSESIASVRRYHGLRKAYSAAKLIGCELSTNAYNKIVIFAYHKDVIDILCKGLARFGCVKITGDTSLVDREAAVDAFQNGNARVFIGNIQSAGVGITLTSASELVFVEKDYVVGNNLQASMRCHRIGQKNPVHVRFFSLAGFDDRLTAALIRKSREIASFIE